MKTRLLAYRTYPLDFGATTTTTSAATTTALIINVSISGGAAVNTIFNVGDELTNNVHQPIGRVAGTTATTLELNRVLSPITSGDKLLLMKEKTYELDLQEAPSIALNYQFADIKNPEQRKASYSQTFKLPFTDNNNDFFQNWFNVNLDSLIFDSSKKFDAALYEGTVTQFEGVIQLKSVLLQAELYEVVLLSNGTNLFTLIGSRKVVDAWTDIEKQAYQFQYTADNITKSWDGSNANFVNTSGVSFQDASAEVNTVIMPMQVTRPRFWYQEEEGRYLRMSSSAATDLINEGLNPFDFMVDITQFKPSIQLRTVLNQIFRKVGFTYTSTFLDSSYFGRLFMTTCNHTGVAGPLIVPTAGAVDGSCIVGNSAHLLDVTIPAGSTVDCDSMLVTNASTAAGQNALSQWVNIVCDTTSPISSSYSIPADDFDLWSTSKNAFLRTDINMTSITVTTRIQFVNFKACYNGGCALQARMTQSDANGYSQSEVYYNDAITVVPFSTNQGNQAQTVIFTIPLDAVDVGKHAHIYIKLLHYEQRNSGNPSEIRIGVNTASGQPPVSTSGLGTLLECQWVGLGTNVYEKYVDTINGIDPDITQKAFLKDLIQRFNLVVIPDNDNPTNLRIEPYNDFVSGGDIKNWTHKLDTSKEIVVKDTTSLQKSLVYFSDKEDVDLMNKSIADFSPYYNVYGKVNIRNVYNEFASGEQKYDSIFSPYINQMVYASNDEDEGTFLPRMAVQYEYSYNRTGRNSYEDTYESTNSKLFYYYGQPTDAIDGTELYYMHSYNPTTNAITVHSFTKYPLCSPYELNVTTGTGTINVGTKSLYWSSNPPVAGDLEVFNSDPSLSILANSLYNTYWAQFYNLIYNHNSKLVECYFNLDEVDIFQFKFNDEIFVKDSYYRVLNISNYQVGAKASTKVSMLKIDEFYNETCNDCDYVLGEYAGSNIFSNVYVWCLSSDAGCTPDLSEAGQRIGAATTEECCACADGDFLPIDPNLTLAGGSQPFSTWPQGHGICVANAGSLPVQLADIYTVRNILNKGNLRTAHREVMSGLYKPLVTGNNTDKYSHNMFPNTGNDIVIKYKAERTDSTKITGESHKIILIGNTTGNVRGYAYINGNPKSKPLRIRPNQVVNIRVKGISTVIGGTSTTNPLGETEAFSYITAFSYKERENIADLGTKGGEAQYNIKQSGGAATCSLYISTTDDYITFGLDDSQTDTKRIWQLTADIDISSVVNMSRGIDYNYALFQNGRNIQLQSTEYLLWN